MIKDDDIALIYHSHAKLKCLSNKYAELTLYSPQKREGREREREREKERERGRGGGGGEKA